jgi:hypothetical protein
VPYHNTPISLRLAKPPRIRIAYRLAQVQSEKSFHAPNHRPNDPPEQDQCADCKMERQKSQEKIEKADPKSSYLKLEMRLAYTIRSVSLKISDHYTDKDRYPRQKPNQIENVDG